MNRLYQALVVGSTVAAFAMGVSRAATAQGAPGSVQPQGAPGMTPAQLAELNGGIPPFTAADVRFMSGMIGHHAQAIVMSGWAQSHGASNPVRTLCERIVVSQQDEIKYMQTWLADRHETVPDADPRGYTMPGTDHPMLMPGMLTPEQMASLDRSRGAHFDRMLLSGMIAHHRGALDMVHQLMTSPGAAQDAGLFAYATDVQAGQAAEIDRMQRMLAGLPPNESRANAAR